MSGRRPETGTPVPRGWSVGDIGHYLRGAHHRTEGDTDLDVGCHRCSESHTNGDDLDTDRVLDIACGNGKDKPDSI